jgi:hypothetical protein
MEFGWLVFAMGRPAIVAGPKAVFYPNGLRGDWKL